MKEGAQRLQPDEDARQTARKKLEQAARNMSIHGQWRNKDMHILSRSLDNISVARRQLDEAAEVLGENPHPKGSPEWNKWNSKYYIQPIEKQLDEERKRK